jgi:tetratricopeptide (TPR) repeat protein
MTYDSLGYAHRHLGHREQATLCYQQSASLFGELGDLYNEADTLVSLGDARESFGDSKLARIAWQDALTIFEQLGLPRAETVRVRMREPGEPAGPIRAASHHYGDEVASDPPPVQRPRRRHMITKRMTGT